MSNTGLRNSHFNRSKETNQFTQFQSEVDVYFNREIPYTSFLTTTKHRYRKSSNPLENFVNKSFRQTIKLFIISRDL